MPLEQMAKLSYGLMPPLIWRRQRLPTVTIQADTRPASKQLLLSNPCLRDRRVRAVFWPCGVGIVNEVGSGCHRVQVGRWGSDLQHHRLRQKMRLCRKLMYSHCTTGGWILGNILTAHRRSSSVFPTPYSLYVPDGADEEAW